MAHKKLNLPEKVCAHCERPFCWRRKWARDWENVRYCSQRCKRAARPANQATFNQAPANPCAPASVEGEF